MANEPDSQARKATDRQRSELVRRLDDWLEWPMLVLGIAWLALLVLELTRGLSPLLENFGRAIWILFIVEFVFRLSIAPDRSRYLRNNWLTALALILPALRVLRFARALRALRAARGLRLARVVTSLNRGMRALGRTMQRRGVGYVAMLTLLVIGGGAAGMYAFERAPEGALDSYGEALWWTAMLLTTIGSESWPQSPEGRMLALLLSMYALGVLGYVTATLASFFIDRDADSDDAPLASARAVEQLTAEVAALRAELRRHDRGTGQGE